MSLNPSAAENATPFAETELQSPVEMSARGTARNSLFSLASFVVSALVVAVTTPVIVHHLGAERYGIFTLSATLVSLLALLDVGLTTALVRFVADRWTVGDLEGLRKFVSASTLVYMGIGVAALGASVVVATVLVEPLFNLSGDALADARFAFLVAGIAVFLSFVGKVYAAVLLGIQRNDVMAVIKIGLSLLTGVGSLVLIYAGFGIRALILLTAATALVGLLAYARMATKLVPQIWSLPRADAGVLRRTLKFSGWIFIANATAFLLFQLDRVLLGTLKSVSLTTYYAIPGSVASYLYVAVVNIAGITIAVGTGLFAQEAYGRVVQLYTRATRFVLVFLLSFGIPAFVLADPILRYWVGPSFANRSDGVLRILVLTYVLLGATVVPYNMILAAGRPHILGLLNLLMLVINVVLIFVLVPPYGLIGTAWAYLLSVAPLVLFVLYAERRVLSVGQHHWLRLLARFAVPAIAEIVVCVALLQIVGNLAEVIAAALIGAAVFLCVYFFGFAEENDRMLVRELARSVSPTRP